jgi:hypothetical protein
MEKQKQKSKKRRAIVILVLLIGVLFISIGYATLSTIVGINGSSIGVSKTVWKVFFKSVDDDKTGNIAPETAATISSDKKEITFAVNLEELGDTYTFDAVIENQSSYDATLTSDPVLVIKKGTETASLPDYITFKEITGGSFFCSWSNIKTMRGFPKMVGRIFDISHSKIESLEHAPEIVDINYAAYGLNFTKEEIQAKTRVTRNIYC